MDIGQLLHNAISGQVDAETRQSAEQQLATAAREHFVPYLGYLTQALGDDNQSVQVRMLAALALKNELVAKDIRTRNRYIERWITEVDTQAKSEIKQTALKALTSGHELVGNATAQLVAAIASIELPRNEWPDLTAILVASTAAGQTDQVKRAALVTIGYICESSDPSNQAVVAQMDGFLTAIIQGAQKSETNESVRLTAINSLVNSLHFIKRNFDNETERNYIMQVVCEATQGQSEELQSASFGALSRILGLYYHFMQPYMEQALFALTVQGMQSESESVACMAVEFWSTVCEEELAYVAGLDIRESTTNGPLGAQATPGATEESEEGEVFSYHFAQRALPQILPVLLNLLTKQDEDADEDDWNPTMAAGACLQLLAQNTRDAIVPTTLQFVEANIQSDDWARRESAVMAFGSIMDGPDVEMIKGLIRQALQPLLALMNDPSIAVKDTVAWCLGRIADNLALKGLDPVNELPPMMEAVIQGLQDHPKVRTHCCWTVINVFEQFVGSHGSLEDSSPLLPFYEQLLRVLVDTSDRPDNEYSSRTSAYEALSSLVMAAPPNSTGQDLVMALSQVALDRLEKSRQLQTQIVSTEDRQNVEELQVNLLGLLTSIIRKVDSSRVTMAADQLMILLGQLLQAKLPNSLIEEDVLITIGAIASSIGAAFRAYVPNLTPYVVSALKVTDSPSAGTAVGLVADMANALGAEFVPYVEIYMAEFVTILNTPDVRRELQPPVISCMGDLASSAAPAGKFDAYLQIAEQIMSQGAQLQIQEETPMEIIDHVCQLREAILDAQVGIVAGYHASPAKIAPYVPSILDLLRIIYVDPEMLKTDHIVRSAVGLIGDLASMFPDRQFSQLFAEPWVTAFIRFAKSPEFSSSTFETARWAREQQKLQQQPSAGF